MERFVIIVNDFQPLTIITKPSILDVVAVLDPPLIGELKIKSKLRIGEKKKPVQKVLIDLAIIFKVLSAPGFLHDYLFYTTGKEFLSNSILSSFNIA